jgi:hypothetical protein
VVLAVSPSVGSAAVPFKKATYRGKTRTRLLALLGSSAAIAVALPSCGGTDVQNEELRKDAQNTGQELGPPGSVRKRRLFANPKKAEDVRKPPRRTAGGPSR